MPLTHLQLSFFLAFFLGSCGTAQVETPTEHPQAEEQPAEHRHDEAALEVDADEPVNELLEAGPSFTVAAWLPYWHRAQGASIAAAHIGSFDSVSPFAFEVQANGTLVDRMSRRAEQWTALEETARAAGVTVVPSLAWMSGSEQRGVLSDETQRTAHVDRIISLIMERNFDGIDIDYEGKAVEDIPHYSAFLRELSARLQPLDVTLVCTVEGRSEDEVPEGANYGQRMPYAVDFAVLGEACDQVRLMAYGQWFLDNGSREFATAGEEPYAPNSDNAWVERVVRFALRSIPGEKILLGVPTHGRLFALGGRAGAWTYESRGAIHFERVQELLQLPSAVLDRPPSGEARLRYGRGTNRRLAYLSDAETLEQRIAMARRLGIAGIALFKIDGREDPGIWVVLEEARRANTP